MPQEYFFLPSYQKAIHVSESYPSEEIPLHIRNAPTPLMKSLGYGKDYVYPPDQNDEVPRASYLPEGLKDLSLYHPVDRGKESYFKERGKQFKKVGKNMKFLVTNLKKLLSLALVFLSFFFMSSYTVRSPERNVPSKINLVNPSEFDLWEVAQGGYVQKSFVADLSLPPKAKEAVEVSPEWLKMGLHSQFRAMDYYSLYQGFESSFSAGDLNGDGVNDLLVSDGEGMLLFYKMKKIPGKSHLKLKFSFPMPIKTTSSAFITLLDLDQDGKSDLFISIEGEIFFLKNTT